MSQSNEPSIDYDVIQTIAAIAALEISIFSLFIAELADRRSKKAEQIKELLGEKESVGFGALKLLRSGFPKAEKGREPLISAVLQACLFEGFDRARALLYRVIEKNKHNYPGEFEGELASMQEHINSMNRYVPAIVDLERASRRLTAVRQVIDGPQAG